MSGFRGSYHIPMPIGLRPVFAASEPLPFTAALGQAFSFGWCKEIGSEGGHAEVSGTPAGLPGQGNPRGGPKAPRLSQPSTAEGNVRYKRWHRT